jgi:hypothetical protein
MRIEVIGSIPRAGAEGEIWISDWIEGALFSTCNIPAGMTIQEAELIV